MLAEFIDRVAGLARASAAAQVIDLEGDSRSRMLALNGVLQDLAIPPPDRHHRLRGIEDLVRMVEDGTIAPAPEVFHDDRAVVAVLDRADRREYATLELERSSRFEALRQLVGGYCAAPRDVVRFLRFELHDSGVAEVLAALRQVDFTRRSSGARTVEHGKESLGRSVEAAVQQAERIPEEFTATVPVFQTSGLREITAKVRVGVYVDVDAEQFELRTLSDEIEQALVNSQRELGRILADRLPDQVPIFHGSVS